MSQCAQFYKLKDRARDHLGGKYGNLLLGCFLFFSAISGIFLLFLFPVLLPALMSWMTGTLSFRASYAVTAQAGLLVCRILAVFFQLGIAYCCLRIICGQPCYYGHCFYGFSREMWRAALGLAGLRLLTRLPFQLPALYILTHWAGSMTYALAFVSLLVYIAGFILYIPVAQTFDIACYLLLDFPERKPLSLLKDSLLVLRGRRARFFLLQLSFLPLYVLCVTSLGAGFLWIVPYAQMTQALFYLELMESP